MKTSSVLLVDISVVQPLLDSMFGIGTFKLDRTIDEQLQWKLYYIEYDDDVSQSIVDQAVEFINSIHNENLRGMKTRWYLKVPDEANKKLSTLQLEKFSPEELSVVQAWVQDPVNPPPTPVVFVSIRDGLSNIDAANYILQSQAGYDDIISRMNAIVSNFQQQILVSDMREGKILIKETLNQINNFVV